MRISTLKDLNSLCSFLLIFFFGGMITNFLDIKTLPSKDEIDPLLMQEPIQNPLKNEPKKEVHYRDVDYTLSPLYEYKIWGLVVSKNDITSVFDSYHDEDSFDTQDLCIIWGKNLETAYDQVKFKSGSFTCYWEYSKEITFSSSHVSNNHLITGSNEIREKINHVKIGDQIYIEGKLANYKSSKGDIRQTSTTRSDTGPNSCEVILLGNIKIIRQMDPSPQRRYLFFKSLFFITIGIKILLMFSVFRKQKEIWEEKMKY